MTEFENMGFSRTVENYKYLTCADCEMDVVGIQYLDQPGLYLSCGRVSYT